MMVGGGLQVGVRRVNGGKSAGGKLWRRVSLQAGRRHDEEGAAFRCTQRRGWRRPLLARSSRLCWRFEAARAELKGVKQRREGAFARLQFLAVPVRPMAWARCQCVSRCTQGVVGRGAYKHSDEPIPWYIGTRPAQQPLITSRPPRGRRSRWLRTNPEATLRTSCCACSRRQPTRSPGLRRRWAAPPW